MLRGHKVLVVDSFKKGVSVLGFKGKLSVSRRDLREGLSITYFLLSLQRTS